MEAEITEQDSLLVIRNLLRIAIFNISYVRGLFPEKYFSDPSEDCLLDMEIKELMPVDAESRRLVDWMEDGVDALKKKYLRTLLFCICEAIGGPMIEEYAFSFSYSNDEGQEVSMNINRTGNKKQGGTFECNSTQEMTPKQMKKPNLEVIARISACNMICTLVQLMRTLHKVPEQRAILIKLLYYDDVTPADYKPPFRGCTAEETHNPWARNPLKREVGSVNSKHFVLALKVKSVLDRCEDDSVSLGAHSVQRDDTSGSVSEVVTSFPLSLGADSVQRDDTSGSDCEVSSSQEDHYIVAPVVSGDTIWTPQHGSTGELSPYLSYFEEIGVVGAGGYGCVAKCHHKIDEKVYAVKKIKLSNQEMDFDHIRREVIALASLDHPNVVKYHNSWVEGAIEGEYVEEFMGDDFEEEDDFGEEDNFGEEEVGQAKAVEDLASPCLYIQQQYCVSSLKKALNRRDELTLEEKWLIWDQVVEGLIHIHDNGLRHGDLTPSNIFLVSGDRVKIGDFGLCTLNDQRILSKTRVALEPAILMQLLN